MLIEKIKNKKEWKKVDNEWWEKTEYYCKSRKKNRQKWVKYLIVNCSICNQIFLQIKHNVKKYKRRYCSPTCRASAIKQYYANEKHMSFNGGIYKNSKGYLLIKQKGHPRADNCNYVKLSVLIMEHLINRFLRTDEIVHHKNEIKDDNRPQNLQLMTDSEHKRYHAIKNGLGGKNA